jgi:hypothetical protein
MLVTVDGMVMVVSPMQFANALLPIVVTLDGNVMEVRPSH